MNDQRNIAPMHAGGRANGAHQHLNVKGRVREQYWPGTLMGLGIFIALGSLFTVAAWTLIEPKMLLRVLLVLSFIGNLLPYLRSGLWLGMERLEWFLFNLLAVGPIGTSVLLWANFLLHGPVTTTEHLVARAEAGRTMLTYHFADGYLAEFPFARATYNDWFPIVGNAVRITEADGLFGIRVLLQKEPFVR